MPQVNSVWPNSPVPGVRGLFPLAGYGMWRAPINPLGMSEVCWLQRTRKRSGVSRARGRSGNTDCDGGRDGLE